jgi:hypothetical protein
VAVVLLAVCCDSPGGRISLDNSRNGQTVSVALADKIDITLQTIGPGEYDTPLVSSGSVRYLGESSPGLQNPGGVRRLFQFQAVAPGRAEITIPHTRDPPLPQTPSFAVTIEVD